MEKFYESIMNSYLVSGKNSVRLMLMTATPITNSPMELIKLLNLCKENQEQMPQEFDEFADKYLEYNTGKFSEEGLKRYFDDTAGYVSYLNREKDARQFAQPKIHLVETPIVDVKEVETLDARGMRVLLNSDILQLKEKIVETNKEIDEELKDLNKNRFSLLKDECKNIEDKQLKKICEN